MGHRFLEFTLNLHDTPFDLSIILESGQVFRWEYKDGWWYGVIDSGVVKIRQDGSSLRCISSTDEINQEYIRTYFRLDEDFEGVLSAIMKDNVINEAIQHFYGLRLIRQPTWECLVSFVIATNSNIPRIRRMISNICRRYGSTVLFEGLEYNLFPTPQALAGATVKDLEECGLGYRAKYVRRVAEAVYNGKVDLSELLIGDYEQGRETLIRKVLGKKDLLGIGPKAADCVLLFSCDKDEAFPIDVWITRAVERYYKTVVGRDLARKLKLRLSGRQNLALGTYDALSSRLRSYFGTYAGYAQQYLFLLARATLPD